MKTTISETQSATLRLLCSLVREMMSRDEYSDGGEPEVLRGQEGHLTPAEGYGRASWKR